MRSTQTTPTKSGLPDVDYLTSLLRLLPAVKPGVFVAGIWISAPVCGFRHFRAARFRTRNVPKPVTTTFSPRSIACATSRLRFVLSAVSNSEVAD